MSCNSSNYRDLCSYDDYHNTCKTNSSIPAHLKPSHHGKHHVFPPGICSDGKTPQRCPSGKQVCAYPGTNVSANPDCYMPINPNHPGGLCSDGKTPQRCPSGKQVCAYPGTNVAANPDCYIPINPNHPATLCGKGKTAQYCPTDGRMICATPGTDLSKNPSCYTQTKFKPLGPPPMNLCGNGKTAQYCPTDGRMICAVPGTNLAKNPDCYTKGKFVPPHPSHPSHPSGLCNTPVTGKTLQRCPTDGRQVCAYPGTELAKNPDC